VAREWLGDGSFVLEVHPYPEHRVAEAVADRSTLPMPETQPEVSFPDFRRTTLSNGLEVVLAQRDAVPLVNLSLVVDAGYAADSHARPGTASLTAYHAHPRHPEPLLPGDRRGDLHAGDDPGLRGQRGRLLGVGVHPEGEPGPSLELFADVALNPTFPEADFQREQRQRLAQIQREKVTPVQMGLRVLPALLYGEDHAYGTPLTGSGTEESVMALNRAELARFHETWYRPNNATLVVVGDISLEELTPRLERLFSGWAPAEVPEKNLAAVDLPGRRWSTSWTVPAPPSR
jgi:zinc protease